MCCPRDFPYPHDPEPSDSKSDEDDKKKKNPPRLDESERILADAKEAKKIEEDFKKGKSYKGVCYKNPA